MNIEYVHHVYEWSFYRALPDVKQGGIQVSCFQLLLCLIQEKCC